jgi:hypothetical protein
VTFPPDWDPPGWRVAWWRVLAVARHPVAWVLAVAFLLLAAGLIAAIAQGRQGCVPHYTTDGRPVMACPRHP